MSDIRAAAALFDRTSQTYDGHYDEPGADGYALRSRMNAVLAGVGDGPGRALDAGMGPGRLAAALAERAWTVSGIDASPEMVALARRRLPEAVDRLVCGDISALPFADGSFDLVVATGSLEYADARRVVPELARVLRVGGTAIVSYPNPRALYGIWKSRIVYRSVRALRTARRSGRPRPQGAGAIRPEGFAELLEVTGFAPPEISYASYLLVPSPVDVFVPRVAEATGRALERTGRFAPLLATQVVYRTRKIH